MEEREKLDQRSRQEKRRELRLKLAKEEETARKELEERRKQRDAERRLRDEENRRADEEHRRLREEQKRLRERDFEQRLKDIKREKRGIEHILKKISTRFDSVKSHEPEVHIIRLLPSKRLFDLYREKNEKYTIKVQDYFCRMLQNSPPRGEIARFYEYFKDFLLGRAVKYQNYPIRSLPLFESEDDLKVLLELIDVKDETGFRALLRSDHKSNVELLEALLQGASAEKRTFVMRQHEDIGPRHRIVKRDSQIKQDCSLFPFLDLPVELQFVILEQLSVGAMLNIQCVCSYFKTLNATNKHVTQLPKMGVFNFADDGWSSGNYQCQLTVMATPTVFHFGLIMEKHYKVPEVTGVDTFIHEMTERIERFAEEDKTFQYDIERLKSFLLHSWQNKHRIYTFEQEGFCNHLLVYVELDASFGVGVAFKSPGAPEPTYWY